MSVEHPTLRQLALEVSVTFDALSINSQRFEDRAKELLDETDCEVCKVTLTELLGAMTIVKPQLYALARVFQFFNFDQAALEQVAIEQLEQSSHDHESAAN